MRRVTRMVTLTAAMIAWGLGGTGCAGDRVSKTAELLFVVETPVDLGRLEFAAGKGNPFVLAYAAEGATIFRQRVRPGQYCLAEVVAGDLNVGYTLPIPRPICVSVQGGERRYGGHLVVTKSGMIQKIDRERLRAQLADETIEVDATPRGLANEPFVLPR